MILGGGGYSNSSFGHFVDVLVVNLTSTLQKYIRYYPPGTPPNHGNKSITLQSDSNRRKAGIYWNSVETRVMDFGFPNWLWIQELNKQLELEHQYMAPEDVFSFGILMYVVLTEKWMPYGEEMSVNGVK